MSRDMRRDSHLELDVLVTLFLNEREGPEFFCQHLIVSSLDKEKNSEPDRKGHVYVQIPGVTLLPGCSMVMSVNEIHNHHFLSPTSLGVEVEKRRSHSEFYTCKNKSDRNCMISKSGE